MAGMEATLFTGWIYDHLISGGAMVKVAHSAMLQAIAAGKKKEGLAQSSRCSDCSMQRLRFRFRIFFGPVTPIGVGWPRPLH